MQLIKPKVFIVGETRVIKSGLNAYLKHAGVPAWKSKDPPSDGELIIEVMGRLCYRSFVPEKNRNVKKVREGNRPYILNILDQVHGSVLEHSGVNIIFADVSRVFTHELVRHRAGTAISQESLRFVRLDQLKMWAPTVIAENEEALEIFVETTEQLEQMQIKLAEIFELDVEGTPFHRKKIVTSAMRRIAPDGLATTIGWSANFRTLRWVLEMRTDPSAEEEIRLVFGQLGNILLKRYPNVFGDFTVVEKEGLPHFVAKNHKV